MTQGQLHIRPYREQDYDHVVHLWQTCRLTRPWNDPTQDITLCLQTESSALRVGLYADRLVGSVMTGNDGHRGWLYYLAIEPDARGRGFARARAPCRSLAHAPGRAQGGADDPPGQ